MNVEQIEYLEIALVSRGGERRVDKKDGRRETSDASQKPRNEDVEGVGIGKLTGQLMA